MAARHRVSAASAGLVRPRPSRSALAAHPRSVPHLGLGDHAAADPRAGRDPLLRALPGAVPHGRGAGGGAGKRRAGAVERPRLLLARPQPAARRAQIAAAGGFPRSTRPSARSPASAITPPPPLPASPSACRMPCSMATCCGWWRASRTMPPISPRRARASASAKSRRLARSAEPGDFNQALMELGATVCLPRNPLCLVCPLAACCRGREEGTAAQLPVKLRRTVPGAPRRHAAGDAQARPNSVAPTRRAAAWPDSGICPRPKNCPPPLRRGLGEFRHTITHHHYTLEVRSATARLRMGRLPLVHHRPTCGDSLQYHGA